MYVRLHLLRLTRMQSPLSYESPKMIDFFGRLTVCMRQNLVSRLINAAIEVWKKI